MEINQKMDKLLSLVSDENKTEIFSIKKFEEVENMNKYLLQNLNKNGFEKMTKIQ